MQIGRPCLGVGPGAVGGELEVGQARAARRRAEVVAGIAERDERRLVRPRLDHHDADRDAVLDAALDFGAGHGLGCSTRCRSSMDGRPTPAVLPGVPTSSRKAARTLAGVAGVQPQPRPRGCVRRCRRRPRRRGGPTCRADVEPGAPRRPDVEPPAVAAGDDGERGRQVGAGALLLVLLEHDARRGAARAGRAASKRSPKPKTCSPGPSGRAKRAAHRSVGGDEPLDRSRDERDVAVDRQLAAGRRATPGPCREPLGRTAGPVATATEAVAQRLVPASTASSTRSPDRPPADVRARAARGGEVAIGVVGRRVQAVGIDGRERASCSPPWARARPRTASTPAPTRTRSSSGSPATGCDGVSLVGIDTVGVAGTERAVQDRVDISPIEQPNSSARVMNMACDHSRGGRPGPNELRPRDDERSGRAACR